MEQQKITKVEKIKSLNQVFTPGKPVTLEDLFCGRQTQLQKIINVIHEQGSHAVLYGNRGVGKTSLANIVKIFIEQSIQCKKVTCNQNDTFGDIWKKVFRQVNLTSKKSGIGFISQFEDQTTSLESLALPN